MMEEVFKTRHSVASECCGSVCVNRSKAGRAYGVAHSRHLGDSGPLPLRLRGVVISHTTLVRPHSAQP